MRGVAAVSAVLVCEIEAGDGAFQPGFRARGDGDRHLYPGWPEGDAGPPSGDGPVAVVTPAVIMDREQNLAPLFAAPW